MSSLSTSAQLSCLTIYQQVSCFDKLFTINETVCGVKLIDKTLYIVNQGTVGFTGWVADFEFLTEDDPILGKLHSGFNKNINELINNLLPLIKDNVEVCVSGHSKGAAEASILGAKLKLAGVNVTEQVLFACPNSGDKQFSTWLGKNIPSGISLRNAPLKFPIFGDPVPLMPPELYPPYPHNLIDVCPSGMAKVVNIEWHRAEYYLAGALLLNKSNNP